MVCDFRICVFDLLGCIGVLLVLFEFLCFFKCYTMFCVLPLFYFLYISDLC